MRWINEMRRYYASSGSPICVYKCLHLQLLSFNEFRLISEYKGWAHQEDCGFDGFYATMIYNVALGRYLFAYLRLTGFSPVKT